MICSKCQSEMTDAQLCGDSFGMSVYLTQKRTDKDDQKDMRILCKVCPECGYIELYSSTPSKFK